MMDIQLVMIFYIRSSVSVDVLCRGWFGENDSSYTVRV